MSTANRQPIDTRNRRRSSLAALLMWLAALALGQESAKPVSPAIAIQQHFQAAQTFQLAGDYDRAAVEYRQTIARALEQIGSLHAGEGKTAEAIELLQRAAAIDPDSPEPSVDLAQIYLRSGDYQKARQTLASVLQQDPQHFRALDLMGKAEFMAGDFQTAAGRFQSALKVQSDFDAAYSLSICELKLKQPAEASVLFDEMLNSMGATPELHLLIGEAYFETGYFEQGAGHFRRAISLDPKHARAHSLLGDALEKMGRSDEA